MDSPLSLLIVDVSEAWEDVIEASERGYTLDFDNFGCRYVRGVYKPEMMLPMNYPHGTIRAGLNAIIGTARLAHLLQVPTYSVELYSGWSDGEEQTCYSLHGFVPAANRYQKNSMSAFKCALADRLASENWRRLMVIGYDRDCCVLETVRDAVDRGIEVVTSEHCMLTTDRDSRRESSVAYFREHTTYLKSLEDVWNCLRKAALANPHDP